MTKEEYERLLKSDYWKGYSYSLIKERNFTCEDCGRSFYNERNKLQVHHLVYRDVNPWSYRPDEVIVLCEECHKRRHGIPIEHEESTSYSQSPFTGYNNRDSISSTSNVKDSSCSKTIKKNPNPYLREPEPSQGFKLKYILCGILLFLVIMIGKEFLLQPASVNEGKSTEKQKESVVERSETTNQDLIDERKTGSSKQTVAKKVTKEATKKETKQIDNGFSNVTNGTNVPSANTESKVTVNPTQTDNNVIEPIAEPTYEEPRKELSTIEILERKNHAEVVKQAKRAGVSTEGSTIDILERINHAEVVKQAKRAGVSTEGSTIDILERINRKEMEKYNY